jgi:hypothetical protein
MALDVVGLKLRECHILIYQGFRFRNRIAGLQVGLIPVRMAPAGFIERGLGGLIAVVDPVHDVIQILLAQARLLNLGAKSNFHGGPGLRWG